MTDSRLAETKEWAVEIAQEEFGRRWKELAPLLIRRLPDIVDKCAALQQELDGLNLSLEALRTAADEDKALIQRYISATKGLGAETPEALTDAVQSLTARATVVEQEKDDLAASLANLQDILDIKEGELEDLRPLVNESLVTKTRLEDLQIVFTDIQSRHEEIQQRTLTLEDALQDAQDALQNARKEYEAHLSELEMERERVMQQAYLPVEEWKTRALTAEAEVERLQDKLRKFKDTLSEANV